MRQGEPARKGANGGDPSSSAGAAHETRTPVELVQFIKDRGPLTKRLSLDADGKLTADSSQCHMTRGVMARLPLNDWRDFADTLEQTPRNVAYALGRLREDLPDNVPLVVSGGQSADLAEGAPRSKETISYREEQPGLVLLDFDVKGMPAAVRAKLDALGGFLKALEHICPGLTAAGYIRRLSTSSGVYRTDTDEQFQKVGEHVYLLVIDGADARRFLYALHDRAWANGLGWHIISASGALLERSIVDRSVCAGERLVFEAAPDLEAPLAQQRPLPETHDGAPFDSMGQCADLTPDEKRARNAAIAASEKALGSEAETIRGKFLKDKVADAIKRGVSREAAERMARNWTMGVLLPDAVLDFSNHGLGEVMVRDVLADPARYTGRWIADPIEGANYSRSSAILRQGKDGVYILSFAHGLEKVYKLKHDYASIRAAILAAEKSLAVRTLCDLARNAELDPADEAELVRLAGDRFGGRNGAKDALKLARQVQQREAAQAVRDRQAVQSEKIRLNLPLPDAEAGPVMVEWDEALCSITTPEPPMRDVEGWPIAIRRRETANLHELTANSANAEEEGDTSPLPSPKHFLLTRHDAYSLEIEIGDHITFVKATEDGERHVAPPGKFITHYLKYERSAAPRVRAVVTMPMVLPDGMLLCRNGLDRERGFVMRVDPEMLKFIPAPEDCTEIAVAKAFRFLIDEWLVDVATDVVGKAILIACALSIIERTLFPERPSFWVSAGLRGGGKTTAITMIILAVLGVKPAASALATDDSNERRKALLAYLQEGLPTIVWDNIPRGARISCPHLERAATSEVYSDRLLGSTKTVLAPAYTIQVFTGNNVGPKGDYASRSLRVQLNVDRPDPENRTFVHPDPIQWTLEHRGEILAALYTVLLGNPPHEAGCEIQTRFKTWQRLVGSAVEHAAMTVGAMVSFKDLFTEAESDDEDRTERAKTLEALLAIFPNAQDADATGKSAEFKAADLMKKLDESAKAAKDKDEREPSGMANLRQFCTPRRAKEPSTKSIGKRLADIVDAPVDVGGDLLSLRRRVYQNETIYWVELKAK